MEAILFTALLLAQNDALCVVRDDFGLAKQPHQVLIHASPDPATSSVGSPVASDLTFQKSQGNNPTLFVLSADVDGDGRDELVHVRQRLKKKDDVQVRVFAAPSQPDGEVGKALASSKKKTLGAAIGDLRVVAMTAGDLDGDGRDEAFVLRQRDDGTQALEIRRMPSKKNQSMKKVLADDAAFGAADAQIQLLAALDVDNDGVDEIATVRAEGGALRFDLLAPPTEAGGVAGPVLASASDLAAPTGYALAAIHRISLDPFDPDRLVMAWRHPTDGTRLEIRAVPTQIDATWDEPLFVDDDVAPAASTLSFRTAFGLAGFAPTPIDPPEDLSGSYQASFIHQNGGVPESAPVPGSVPATHGGDQFQVLLPTFHPLVGTYSPSTASVDFGGSTAIIDQVSIGVTYVLNVSVATVTVQAGEPVISGTYDGIKLLPFGQQQPVTEGTYSLRRLTK